MQCIRYSSKNYICLDAIRLTNTLSLYLSPLCRLWSKTEYEANLNNLPQEQRSPVFAKPTMFDCSSSWSNDQKGIKMLNEKLAEPWLKHQQQSIHVYIQYTIFNTHMCVLFGWHWHMREHRGPYRSPRLQARSLNKVIFLHFILYYLSLSMSKESWLFLAGQDLQRGPSQPGGQVHLPSTGSQLKLKWFQNWIDTDGSIDHHIQVATKSK